MVISPFDPFGAARVLEAEVNLGGGGTSPLRCCAGCTLVLLQGGGNVDAEAAELSSPLRARFSRMAAIKLFLFGSTMPLQGRRWIGIPHTALSEAPREPAIADAADSAAGLTVLSDAVLPDGAFFATVAGLNVATGSVLGMEFFSSVSRNGLSCLDCTTPTVAGKDDPA